MGQKCKEEILGRGSSRHEACVYLCPFGASAMCALSGSHEGFGEYVRKMGGGGRDEQCSLVHCTLSAVLPLACFVRRRPLWNPLRNGKSGPSETTTQTPYPRTSSSAPQKPLATKQRAGGEQSEGEKRRSTEEEECTLQWLPHSGAVAPRCVKAAECFQLPSTLSPQRVRMKRTNERRRVTGCERRPQKREKGNNGRQNGSEHFQNVPRGEFVILKKFAVWDVRRLNGVKASFFLGFSFASAVSINICLFFILYRQFDFSFMTCGRPPFVLPLISLFFGRNGIKVK